MSPARDFDGVDDKLDFGSDASIDGFISLSMSCWVVRDTQDRVEAPLAKHNSAATLGWAFVLLGNTSSNRIRFRRFWTTTATWTGTTTIATSQIRHIAIVYDGAATSNDPTIYVDGVAEALTVDTNPTGTITTDAAELLLSGENSAGGSDLDGALQNVCYANALWTAAQANRAKWYGSPGGPMAFYHPLLTTKLTNEGTATANGTATGTTMRSLPRTERMMCASMGCGR